MDISDI